MSSSGGSWDRRTAALQEAARLSGLARLKREARRENDLARLALDRARQGSLFPEAEENFEATARILSGRANARRARIKRMERSA